MAQVEKSPTTKNITDFQKNMKPGIQWKWKKSNDNFVPYDDTMNARIEKAYQEGRPFILMRMRGTEEDPIEVWFGEMKQITRRSNQADEWHDIERIGPQSFTCIANRKLKALKQVFNHGFIDHEFKKYRYDPEKEGVSDVQRLRRLETADSIHSWNIRQLYYGDSCFSKIAKHSIFTFLTSVVIILNTVWLGIDAHYNDAASLYEAHWKYAVVENIFCMFYLAELIIRIGAFEKKSTCIRDGWVIFDATLLVLMVVEIWVIPLYLATLSSSVASEHVDADSDANKGGEAILRVARMLKVLRLGRLAKLVFMIPELRLMCMAIFKAMQSVFFTVLMLASIIYVFAVIFVSQMRDQASITEELPDFKSMPGSMWVLLIEGVLLDEPSNSLRVFVKYSYVMTTLFLVFIALSAFTILNMLIGILCQVVDKETQKKRDADDERYLRSTLLELMRLHDEDDDKKIQKNEFDILMKNPLTRHVLTRFGVDADDLLLMKDNLFDSKQGALAHSEEIEKQNSTKVEKQNVLSHSEVLKVVQRLRGSNTSKVTDIVDLREYMNKRFLILEKHFGLDSQDVANRQGNIDAMTEPSTEGYRQAPASMQTGDGAGYKPSGQGCPAVASKEFPEASQQTATQMSRASDSEKYTQEEVSGASRETVNIGDIADDAHAGMMVTTLSDGDNSPCVVAPAKGKKLKKKRMHRSSIREALDRHYCLWTETEEEK